ncbi:hypothetical protein KI688_007055 [Linnemannia hyalina]|uniref:Uncharacterized protein n=1 Tax=Linnemannia hyalina TaxID=64524 RepID=A0A9P7XL27_9FUNG|nr:hypothetical protein KI688_007055 [Linnemannia hyalina]
MSTVTKVDWEDPRDFNPEGFDSIDRRFDSIVWALEEVEKGVEDMERAERHPTIYNNTTMLAAFNKELSNAGFRTAKYYSILRRWNVPKDYGIVICHYISPPRYRYRFTRRFRDDGDEIRFTNDTNIGVYIMSTQELVTAMKTGRFVWPAWLHLGFGVAKEQVSKLKIAPRQSQEVTIAPTYVMVSVFADRGKSVTLLYHDVLVKKGYNHIVQQRDINNSFKDNSFREYTKDEFLRLFFPSL